MDIYRDYGINLLNRTNRQVSELYYVLQAWYYYTATLLHVKWDANQWDACMKFLINKYGIWNFCRGGGKTEKGTILVVFLSILGYQCIWWAGAWTQLTTALRRYKDNPYIRSNFKVSKQRDNVELLNGWQIDLFYLSEHNCRGKRAEVAFYDEVIEMNREDFNYADGCWTHFMDPYHMYFSTPKKATVFEDMCIAKAEHVIHKSYLECSYMNHQKIKELHQDHGGITPDWQWRQEYKAEFVLAGGSVFQHNLIEVEFGKVNHLFNDTHKSQGVDFGGGTVGHSLSQIAIVDLNLYITREIGFQYKLDDELLQMQCSKFPTQVEGGGWNETFAPDLYDVQVGTFDEKEKPIYINALLHYKIHIDPVKCPKTLRHISNAYWEQDSKGRAFVDTSKLHYLAALLHAVRANQGSEEFFELDDDEEQTDFQYRFEHADEIDNTDIYEEIFEFYDDYDDF
jgi:hypothetical protein